MSAEYVIRDDRTGKRIPKGAHYFHIQARQEPAYYFYYDVATPDGIAPALVQALSGHNGTSDRNLTIEIFERTV